MRKHPEFAQLMAETLPWIHPLLYRSLGCRINTNTFLMSKALSNLAPVCLYSFLFPFLVLYVLLASSGFPTVAHPTFQCILTWLPCFLTPNSNHYCTMFYYCHYPTEM